MPTEKRMKNRGDSAEMVTTVEGVDVSCVAWLDNKQVMLQSTLAGKVYSRHMGGVDLLDSHLGRHRNNLRSKKWYMKNLLPHV